MCAGGGMLLAQDTERKRDLAFSFCANVNSTEMRITSRLKDGLNSKIFSSIGEKSQFAGSKLLTKNNLVGKMLYMPL